MDLQAILIAALAVLGLLIGSFLNVVIYRVPRHESLLFPASHCPDCATPIKARHNTPVLGWIALRGRCAHCRVPISPRYPLVELATAALFAGLAARFGMSAYLPAYLFLGAVGIVLAMIDVDDLSVPDAIVLPAWVVGALLLMPAGAANGDWHRAVLALGGLALLVAVYVAIAVSWQRAIDAGLIRLVGLVGFALGWLSWVVLLVGASFAVLAGALAGSVLVTTGRRIGTSSMPIGMFVLAAAAIAVFAPLPLATL